MVENKIYLFKEEFWPLVGITECSYKRRKEDLYEWMSNFFDYEILNGKPMRIKINEVIGEYKPLPRKKPSQNKLNQQKLKDYEVFTIAALGTEFKPNSKAKIVRDAIADFGYEKYSHTSQEAVTKRFIKPAFDAHAETNEHMVWVDYNNYEILTEEQIVRWKEILSEEQMNEEQRANAFDRMMQGEDISKEKKFYRNALDKFKKEFGFIPAHVREWKCGDPD